MPHFVSEWLEEELENFLCIMAGKKLVNEHLALLFGGSARRQGQ